MKQMWSKEEIEALIPKLYAHDFVLTFQDNDDLNHSVGGVVLGYKKEAYTLEEFLAGVQQGKLILMNTIDDYDTYTDLYTGISSYSLDEQVAEITFIGVSVEPADTILPFIEHTFKMATQDLSYTESEASPLM